jgi:gamma-glutamylcyclotransferase (GGCT)/AIG2-like uncharacterized protein YtfP
MDETGRHLFVYGTLMSTAAGALGRAQRERLARESRGLGPAAMAGARLYDLGRYPGLVESSQGSDVVHGEVVALLNPQRTLAWLDAYEGVLPGDPSLSEYARLERPIQVARGETLQAWVYVFLRDVARRRRIANGRW